MTIPTDNTLNSGDLVSKQRASGYILHSSVNRETNPHLLVSSSTKEILLYDLQSQAKLLTFSEHSKPITGLQFSKQKTEIFFSSSLDGNIFAWDTRSGLKPIQSFYDNTGKNPMPFLCFDYNVEELYICAGTELIREDSFLIFWDRRTSKNLGGYWESHTNDITQLQFDPSCSSVLSSSSTDGLINFFDLNETCESDALSHTINTESSINKFSWNPEGYISCLNSIEEYQIWTHEESESILKKSREDLSQSSKQTVDYLIDCFAGDEPFDLVTGSNTGLVHFHQIENDTMRLTGVLKGGHSDVVRTLSYFKDDCLFTGGEDGLLCIWKLNFD